uniref:Uncharacterized protein n=1 Tax=Arundo donax TaxID=35708 RepID=A0A0A8XW80_ARUDO
MYCSSRMESSTTIAAPSALSVPPTLLAVPAPCCCLFLSSSSLNPSRTYMASSLTGTTLPSSSLGSIPRLDQATIGCKLCSPFVTEISKISTKRLTHFTSQLSSIHCSRSKVWLIMDFSLVFLSVYEMYGSCRRP